MAEPNGTEGQAAAADTGDAGTTVAAPGGESGQSAGTGDTTPSGHRTETQNGESTFFDPKSLDGKPELQAAYKQMQGKFTKAMQGIRGQEQQLQLVKQFEADPVGTIRRLAPQYGVSIVDGQPPQQQNGQPFQPKNWEDVVSHIRSEVMSELNEQYQPLVGAVKDLKQQNIEQYFDSNHADWRTYEQEMIENLQAHPTLANDPDRLYEMSVPREVRDARAMEAALKKLKGETESSRVSGSKTATHVTHDQPKGKLSFNDAVKYAKAKLAKDGIGGGVAG